MKSAKLKGTFKQDLTWNSFAEARQPKGMPLISTEDFTSEEVKEIADKGT